MTRDRTNRVKRRAGATDQVVFDWKDGFGGDGEGAFEEEIVDADDRASERVFDWGKESVGEPVADGTEGSVEGGARDRGDGLAEELDSGFFAEGTGLALESYAHFKDDSTPRHRHRVGVFFEVLDVEEIHIGRGFKSGPTQKRVCGTGRRGILREGDGK
jgi:hypothetical protein